jgi:hypothetical protein
MNLSIYANTYYHSWVLSPLSVHSDIVLSPIADHLIVDSRIISQIDIFADIGLTSLAISVICHLSPDSSGVSYDTFLLF